MGMTAVREQDGRRNPERSGIATRIACGCAFALLLVSASASAWWNGDWALRKQITIDASAALQGSKTGLSDVPVLIRLHEGVFDFTQAAQDGADLRFVAEDDTTPLAFHIEKFDPIFNLAFVWVKLPAVAPGKPVNVWMYYGNEKATAGSEPDKTWDANQTLVYHFAERGTPAVDSTAFHNTALTTVAQDDGGLIGSAAKFDGQSIVSLPASPSLNTPAGGRMTLSLWVKPAAGASGVLYAHRDGATGVVLGLNAGAPYVSIIDQDGQQQQSASTTVIDEKNWHHIAVVAGEQLTLYVDGKAEAPIAARLPPLNVAASVGGEVGVPGAAVTEGFSGLIDELQIAKVARDAAWIRFASVNQGPNDSIVRFGADEGGESGHGGYIGIIMGSVTIDGWVVIGVLIVMIVISVYIMIVKAIQISRVAKGNDAFLAAFNANTDDFATFSERVFGTGTAHVAQSKPAAETARAPAAGRRGDTAAKGRRRDRPAAKRAAPGGLIARAPLALVFRIGVEELDKRVARDAGTPREGRMSSQSIDAIRTAIETGLTREMQSLSSLMVLLTIAISGGPFIGLLGTVVGVMITFAGVAAAGDVNINAIAPGISAALAATVVGLFVAIPALFGYNYLITRIKELNATMHIFVEQLVARMAEIHSGGE